MDYLERVQDAEPNTVVSLPANSSKMFLDSSSRNRINDPHATTFESYLGLHGAGLKRVTHRTIQWMQPLYTHNMKNWELVMSFDGDGFIQKYAYFMTPYVIFKEYSDPSDPYGFATPADNSYAKMVETCITTGARKVESSDTVELVQPGATLRFRYSADRGFCMYSVGAAVKFRIEYCSWLQRAYNIHGFGVRLSATSDLVFMNPSFYATGTSFYFSDATPILMYTRYICISSRELCRNRKITSFTNTKNPALAGTELNVIPTQRAKLNVLHTYTTEEDPTVVNMRYGDNIQFLRIEMVDEFGEQMLTGSPLENAIATGLDPAGHIFTMLTSASSYSNDVVDLIIDNETFFQQYENIKLPDTPIVHVLETTMI